MIFMTMTSMAACATMDKEMVCKVNGFGSESPVIWNNLKISFPDSMIYNDKSPEFIALTYWDYDGNDIMFMMKSPEFFCNERVISSLIDRGCNIISVNDVNILNSLATDIELIREDGKYNRLILVPEQLLMIVYGDDKDKFKDYEGIIKGLEVIEEYEGEHAPYYGDPETTG